MEIDYVNEYLRARSYSVEEGPKSAKTDVITPDLISLVETGTCEPFLSEDLRDGLRVTVI